LPHPPSSPGSSRRSNRVVAQPPPTGRNARLDALNRSGHDAGGRWNGFPVRLLPHPPSSPRSSRCSRQLAARHAFRMAPDPRYSSFPRRRESKSAHRHVCWRDCTMGIAAFDRMNSSCGSARSSPTWIPAFAGMTMGPQGRAYVFALPSPCGARGRRRSPHIRTCGRARAAPPRCPCGGPARTPRRAPRRGRRRSAPSARPPRGRRARRSWW